MNAFICSSLGIFSTLCRKYIANIVLRYQREIDRCCAVYGVLYVLDAFYEMCASVTLVNNTICTFYPPYDCRVFLFFVLFFALAWSFWCCRIFYIFFFGRRYEIFLNVLWWLCAATIAVLMLSSFPFSILMFFSFTFIRSVSVFFFIYFSYDRIYLFIFVFFSSLANIAPSYYPYYHSFYFSFFHHLYSKNIKHLATIFCLDIYFRRYFVGGFMFCKRYFLQILLFEQCFQFVY